MALPTYETPDTLTIINDQCESLPHCPACGGLTNLDQIVIERTAAAGSGRWVAYVLRCLDSVDPNRLRRNPDPLCTFAIPMTLQPTT